MASSDKAPPGIAGAPAPQPEIHPTDALGRLAALSLARHMTSDAMHPAELLDLELMARLRASHEAQLAGQGLEGRLEWALGRILQLEARLLILQGAMLSQAAAPPEPVLAPPAVAAPPAPAKPAPAGPVAKPAAPPRPAAREAVLRCDADLRCTGFYDTEIRQDRPPLRWIGPSTRAELWLPRVEAPVELRFVVAGLFVPEVLKEIRFSVDGGPWTRPELEEAAGTRVLVLRPPPGPGQAEAMMHVAIDTVLQDSPANRGGQDKRKLSIAFSRVEARRS